MESSNGNNLVENVKVGDKVRSYDFEVGDDCYIEGIVEAIGRFDDFGSSCFRYKIRVEKTVWEGKEIRNRLTHIYPPVNGTPKFYGGVTHRVVKI